MVKFEYKIHHMSALANQYVFQGQVDGSNVESVINCYADEGWEYQNTIVNPYVTDGEHFLKPSLYIIFRRVKS